MESSYSYQLAINANKIWGMHNWTQGTPVGGILQIAKIAVACGKIGTANVVPLLGCKMFLEHWKLTIISHQVMEMLIPEAHIAIKLHKHKYKWIDPLPNKTIDDGHSLLNEVSKLICSDFQMNVCTELVKIKTIKSDDF